MRRRLPLLPDQARALGGTAAVLLCAATLQAGSLPSLPSFGTGVEVVNLSLSVMDPRGRHVSDLAERDLAVYEDGVRQQVCLFSREKLPIALTILIDSSASMQPSLPVAKAAAIRLLGSLGPQDEAEVVQFNRHYTVLQEFTSDHEASKNAIQRIETSGETILYGALYVALKELSAHKREGGPRRTAIVVLSDGEDTASLVTDEQVLGLARQADVSVYPIGLTRRPADPTDTGVPTFFFTALARETGGRAYFPLTLAQLDGAYDGIADELRTLYGVGYVSSNASRDGGWRRIGIQTTGRSLLFRHRPGYYAAPIGPIVSIAAPARVAGKDPR